MQTTAMGKATRHPYFAKWKACLSRISKSLRGAAEQGLERLLPFLLSLGLVHHSRHAANPAKHRRRHPAAGVAVCVPQQCNIACAFDFSLQFYKVLPNASY